MRHGPVFRILAITSLLHRPPCAFAVAQQVQKKAVLGKFGLAGGSDRGVDDNIMGRRRMGIAAKRL